MPSNKNSPTFEAQIRQFTNCCGVGVLCNFTWATRRLVRVRDYWTNKWVTRSRVMNVRRIANKQIIPALKDKLDEAFKAYTVVYATLTDNNPIQKQHLNLMKRLGWREENIAKSNHGDYHIYVISMTKAQWKAVRKQYEV